MLTNSDSGFDIREFQRDSQLDITSSAATQIGLSKGHHNPLLGNSVATKQPEHFNINVIDPNLFDTNSGGDGFHSNAYNDHENFVPNDLEHAQGEDFSMSPSQNQNCELDELSMLINHPELEDIFDQIKG